MKRTLPYESQHTLSFADYGDVSGYPILIQHGMIASILDHTLFDPLIEAGMRVILIARPGYGDSTPYQMHTLADWGAIVSGLVDTLQLSQFSVLGLSSGAPICANLRMPREQLKGSGVRSSFGLPRGTRQNGGKLVEEASPCPRRAKRLEQLFGMILDGLRGFPPTSVELRGEGHQDMGEP